MQKYLRLIQAVTLNLPSVSIGAVSERDVDFLLVEEFASSPSFARWFLERADVTVQDPVEVVRCRRSATDSIGESDVEIFDFHGTHFSGDFQSVSHSGPPLGIRLARER